MADERPFRAYVVDADGTRTEMPELYVESGIDALRDAMSVAMERLATDSGEREDIVRP